MSQKAAKAAFFMRICALRRGLSLCACFFRVIGHRSTIVNQMADGENRVADQHARSGPAHDRLDFLPFCRLIAVNGAVFASGFSLAEIAAFQSVGRVVKQPPVLLPIIIRRGMVLFVQFDHQFDGTKFSLPVFAQRFSRHDAHASTQCQWRYFKSN